jgi:MFS family permease
MASLGVRGFGTRVGFGLSREIWLIEAGVFLNMLGYGGVLPFEIIYLHNGRGFGLGVAGLVIGAITGVAVVISPAAGQLIDRFGARLTAIAAGVALAAGYGGLAFAHTPPEAFAAAACAGAGNGVLSPSQTTLLTTLAPPDIRHRVTAVYRVAGNAGIGIGGALGGLVAAHGLTGFVALFVANAVSYLVFVVVLAAVVHASPRRAPVPGGYRQLLRDRAFVHLAVADVAMIAVGWGVFSWLLPPFAKNQIGLSTTVIGLLLLANAMAVVVAQVPVARFAEGRRRALTMALAGALFCGACLLVEAADASRALAVALLVVAVIAAGVGECLHTTALTPLVAELAPAHLRGRYMAAIGLCFWIGLAAAPTGGTALLGVSPTAAFGVAAGLALAAAAAMLRLERRLPEAARRTPRPERARG